MKNRLSKTIGLVLLAVFTLIVSCKKEKTNPVNNGKAAIFALWKVNTGKEQHYYDGKLISEKIKDTSKDQVFIHFNPSGTLKLVGFDGGTIDFKYTYNPDTKQVTVTPDEVDGDKIVMKVKELTKEKLVLLLEMTAVSDSKSKGINEYTCVREIDWSLAYQ